MCRLLSFSLKVSLFFLISIPATKYHFRDLHYHFQGLHYCIRDLRYCFQTCIFTSRTSIITFRTCIFASGPALFYRNLSDQENKTKGRKWTKSALSLNHHFWSGTFSILSGRLFKGGITNHRYISLCRKQLQRLQLNKLWSQFLLLLTVSLVVLIFLEREIALDLETQYMPASLIP